MTVIFVEKFHELNVRPPALPDCLLEECPGEAGGDHGVGVSVQDDDGDPGHHQAQLGVRGKVDLGPGSEEPGEDGAREEGGPGRGPGETGDLV